MVKGLKFNTGEFGSLILRIKVGSLTHNPSKINSKCNKGLNVNSKDKKHVKIQETHYCDLKMGKILIKISKPQAMKGK